LPCCSHCRCRAPPRWSATWSGRKRRRTCRSTRARRTTTAAAGSSFSGCGTACPAEPPAESLPLALRCRLRDDAPERFGVPHDDPRACELDPTLLVPGAQILIGDLAGDAEEAGEVALRDPELHRADAGRASVQR